MRPVTKGIVAVFLVLLTTVALEWALGAFDGVFMVTLVLTFIFGMFTALVLSATLPSPHPSAWWFISSFIAIGVAFVGVRQSGATARSWVPCVVGGLLGVAWWGTRRNFWWAWDWTRRVYRTLFACLLVFAAVLPLSPERFRDVYEVDESGLFWSIVEYLLSLALLAALFVRSRDVFKTPVNARHVIGD